MPDLIDEFVPSGEEIRVRIQHRKTRYYQRHSRGGKNSASDLYENTAIVLAWEAGELTEGQAMRALGMDRVSVREFKLKSTAMGRALAHELI